MSTPSSRRWVAKLCLNVWQWTSFRPARFAADDTIFCPFPIIALSSKRKTLVRYWENAGVEAWMREHTEEQGFGHGE